MRLVVALGLLLAACKGDIQKCEQACRNYGTLMYWKAADVEIAAVPAAERDALRKRKLTEFSTKLENGVDLCISQCQSANNDKDMDCMIAAKTAEQVKACVEN